MAENFEKVRERKNWIVLALLVGILVLGNRLREFSYASVPNPGETADEYSFGWLGISLLREKRPIAWSGISAYEQHDFQKINVDGLFDKDPHRPLFAIDKPWFDHPPLFGLVTGGYAYFKGVRDFADASVIILRRPMLKIALLTTVLVFILGTRLYGVFVGLLSALLYSTIPTLVISSRLALAENGYIPLFLGSLILAHYYLEKKKRIFWVLSSLLAGVALLFKLSAVVIPISLVLIAFMFGGSKKRDLISIVLITTASALALFAIYGFYFGWDTFLRVLQYNSQRPYGAGAEVFFQAVNQFRITTTKFLSDGWLIFGWISLFLLSFAGWKKDKSATLITLAVFSYLAIFLIFGSESYGWYKFPFLPFLVLSISVIFKKLLLSPNLFVFSSLILLPFGTSVHRLLGVNGFQQYVPTFRLFTLFLLGVVALGLFSRKKSTGVAQKIFIIAATAFTIWLSIQEIYFYTIENWYFVT